ncbi:uncharacterized protein sb:cb288 [Clinocottus analis]|uniref:uncharacterized protein sb:cb288 n=1 Tax=Clinocottus analis TaxID=304258 RepID=UPI0035C1741D
MWTEVRNKSHTDTGDGNSSEMVDPDVTLQLFHSVQLSNDSTAAARPSGPDDSVPSGSGIVPGAIAAAVFIALLLALYAVLWRCMVAPPRRKHSKVRVRVKQRTSV